MDWLMVVILAIVQGVTEFLPISSSGHLFMLEKIVGTEGDMMFFNVMLHFASALAILVALWPEVKKFITGWRLWLAIGVATVPGVVGGLFFKDIITVWAENYWGLAVGWLVTGVFMWLIDRVNGDKKYEDLDWWSALKIGLFQMLALMPGISRSGSTMLGGKLMKLDRENSVKYSFLLALPIVMGAGVYELFDTVRAGDLVNQNVGQVVVGFLVCFFVSWLTIHLFLKHLRKIPLQYFGYYVSVLAVVAIILGFL